MQGLVDRFLRYVKIDTQSDPYSKATPSTKKQWDLANKLVEELKAVGLAEVEIDEKSYIMASLPANTEKEVPTIGFISHFDTTPDFTGTNVKPRIIEDYDGKEMILNADKGIILSPSEFEDLERYHGQTLIVTDGTTLLGADDKAGIAEIISAMEYLIQHPDIEHGRIRIGFTPDEEIGRGAHHFDVEKFGADWAYTVDGSQIGELEYENFNAASAVITASGKSVHPGYAKDKLVNAIGLLHEFIAALPKEEVPERTEEREGFFHVHKISGSIEQAELEMIIRDHDRSLFEDRKKLVEQIVEKINKRIPGSLTVKLEDQYFNMKEKVVPVMHIVNIAEEAMKSLGITPVIKPIRGGTDGSQLSYMGLPCPNIFAGGHNFHGKYEYVPVESMQKAVETIVKICELTAKRNL